MTFFLHISYKNFVCVSHLLHACCIPKPYHSVPAITKVTGLRDERHGVQIPEGTAGFLSSNRLWGLPSILCQWVNRPGREANNSCPLRTGRATRYVHSPYVFAASAVTCLRYFNMAPSVLKNSTVCTVETANALLSFSI
jgi:hypothetical protein